MPVQKYTKSFEVRLYNSTWQLYTFEMNPLRTNRSHSLSLISLLLVVISLVKSCEAQSDTALVAISIPTLIVVFFVCALCWLSCAIKKMREMVPSDNQATRRSNLPILAITPFASYRRAYLFSTRPPLHTPPAPTTSRVPDPRPKPNPSTHTNIPCDPTKLAVHDPYDDMFVMEAKLHQAEAPPNYEEAVRMPATSNADKIEGESDY